SGRGRESAPWSDAKDEPGVIADPDSSETDRQEYRNPADRQDADDLASAGVDAQDRPRVEVRHPQRAEGETDVDGGDTAVDPAASRPVRARIDLPDGTSAVSARDPDGAFADGDAATGLILLLRRRDRRRDRIRRRV